VQDHGRIDLRPLPKDRREGKVSAPSVVLKETRVPNPPFGRRKYPEERTGSGKDEVRGLEGMSDPRKAHVGRSADTK